MLYSSITIIIITVIIVIATTAMSLFYGCFIFGRELFTTSRSLNNVLVFVPLLHLDLNAIFVR